MRYPFFYGPEGGVERPVSQRWNENTGFEFSNQHIGTYPDMLRQFYSARRCGFVDATLTPIDPGNVIWSLELNYIGRTNPESRLFRPQIEQQTSYWFIRSRQQRLPLWRHPVYEPLLNCEIEVGRQLWEPNLSDPGGTASEIISWVGRDGPPPPINLSITANENYPYLKMVEQAALGWRGSLRSQMDAAFDEILLQFPSVTGELSISGAVGFPNLTEQFDITRHMVCQVSRNGSGFQLLPKYSAADPSNKIWSRSYLIRLAQNYANEFLAGRTTYPYNRFVVQNDRVVSSRGGMGLSSGPYNMIWSSSKLIELIQAQALQRQRDRIRGFTPLACQEVDRTFQEIIYLLRGQPNTFWLKHAPNTRLAGRGRIEVSESWEAMLRWELSSVTTPLYDGPVQRRPVAEVPAAPGPGIAPTPSLPPGSRGGYPPRPDIPGNPFE